MQGLSSTCTGKVPVSLAEVLDACSQQSRTFCNDRQTFSELDPVKNCISAARSCINAAELVRDFVPPSHYLALSVHCLTISGLAL